MNPECNYNVPVPAAGQPPADELWAGRLLPCVFVRFTLPFMWRLVHVHERRNFFVFY
jgi:hypothetical protein